MKKLKTKLYSKRHPLSPRKKGQVVLILVLLTMIGLTIGLSLISRTVTDVRISSQIEQSSRAFSAAEAGVETALKVADVAPTGSVTFPGASAEYEVSDVGGGSIVYELPLTDPETAQTIWLANHDSDGYLDETSGYPTTENLEICWGAVADVEAYPALVLSLIYKDGTSYKIAKQAYRSDSSDTENNNFSASEQPNDEVDYCDSDYPFRKIVTAFTDFGVSSPTAILLAIRAQPVYERTPIAIKPDHSSFPVQGKKINSIGKTDTGVVRKIQVIQGYAVLPSLLDFTLFAETGN